MNSELVENSELIQKSRLFAYLQLMRPANIVTAWADVLAGFAAAGAAVSFDPLGWLLLATTGLYGGGVVFNDIFDAELDTVERPERPLPSGRASMSGAIALGSFLLVGGIVAAVQVSAVSGAIALAVALLALVYDAWGKHQSFLAPLNMGACRGGNLLLGVSATPGAVALYWTLAWLPVAYIAAVTALSRGEVKGGKPITGVIALSLLGIVIGALVALALWQNWHWQAMLPFLILLAARVFPPFVRATLDPQAQTIRHAIKRAVLSLIILNATLAAGLGGWIFGLVVLALLPVSLGLARLFAVT